MNWRHFVAYLIITAAFMLATGWSYHAGHLAQQAANQIQQERVDSILRACRDQNMRHNRTVAAVQAAPSRANVDKGIVIQIVDAVAPKVDCNKLVQQSTSDLPGK